MSSGVGGLRVDAGQPHLSAKAIRLTNLDSTQQAMLWRTHGREEAMARTIAMVRSALLLSDTIVMDRNQLLDGVALLALGPAGLRWHLGLAPDAALPMTVTCAPAADGGIDVAAQVTAVEDPSFVSSAAAALQDSGDVDGGLRWMLPPSAGKAGAPLRRGFRALPVEVQLASARAEWAAELQSESVSVVPWAPVEIVRSLQAAADRLPQSLPLARDLVELAHDKPSRSAAVDFLSERVGSVGVEECRAAFVWWTGAYYDAICEANKELRISFHGAGAGRRADTPALASAVSAAEVRWSVSVPPRSRWEVWRARLSTRRVANGSVVRFEGEIVESMRVMAPALFRQLVSARSGEIDQFWGRPTSRGMFDVVLAVRRCMDTTRGGRSRLVRWRWVQFALIAGAAIALGLRDIGVFDTSGAVSLALWSAIAFAVTFPWGHLRELVDLSPVSMTATLRVMEDPRPRMKGRLR